MGTLTVQRKTLGFILFYTLMATITTPAQEFHNPPALFDPTPYAFSHAAEAPATGSYVFISGQSGRDDNSGAYSLDFRNQVQNSLKHLMVVLSDYDLVPENIVKITVLIVDHSSEKLQIWSEEMHKVWDPKKFPTSTLIPVPRLASDGMLFEVDAIAYRPPKP